MVVTIFDLLLIPTLVFYTAIPSIMIISHYMSFSLAHVPSLQLSTVTPSPSDPALPWASPSSGSLTVSLTLLRCDGAFMQSISDQAGVMQLVVFFRLTVHCKYQH
ncbi:Hypothetical_protein [Hexamita inflata]|uniref:Hypothetical_protein n=1 Tax=Hexamita inflata TaxID=28002 RepID=A0AA86Q5B1_9EUKA|nr:Hypothetical protein HINF_LOCUS37257 [Hexamita inflata]